MRLRPCAHGRRRRAAPRAAGRGTTPSGHAPSSSTLSAPSPSAPVDMEKCAVMPCSLSRVGLIAECSRKTYDGWREAVREGDQGAHG
eukprot:245655-Prymnesium_polylepis.1